MLNVAIAFALIGCTVAVVIHALTGWYTYRMSFSINRWQGLLR